ncbi:hypothetical protein SPISAL_03735 [Spiribacter salinus M19-40]|jgi:hypothetical protein|uniref:Uncharacterized protein n=1 Tax=Spiribacter salinus M19-40 TaxID=1260251 RepID=R4VF07_9GAMM|nr:hypothetical protein [Spiribacter salinus]AGM40841.1 hypothetical protein SPISAL_03735 [Spiribacter salinus M19-40]MBY5268073.1 hypothetical protein [Spiribacter salinus]MDR9414484.1 hypothetical protein [Spiribacter sp.]
MRILKDEAGVTWRIDVLAASYGVVYLIFSAEAAGPVRKAPIDVASELDASAELVKMSEPTLQQLLTDSTPFEETSPLGF